MKKFDLGQYLTLLANAGVIAGIIFLAVELQQNTRAVEIASAQEFLSTTASLDMTIAENGEVAYLLSQATDSLDEVERLRAERFRYSALRQWENAYYLYSVSALDETFWLAYRNELKNIMTPGGRMGAHWLENQESFTPSFNEEMERILREDEAE